MNFCVLRIQKIHSLNALRGAEIHGKDRSKVHQTYPDREKYNIISYGKNYKDCTNIVECYRKATSNVQRTIRRDAVRAIELVLSASDFSNINFVQWSNASMRWVNNTFDIHNVMQIRADFDEKMPHLHILICPIQRSPEQGDRLCAKDWLGGSKKMVELQDSYAEAMSQFGLARGKHLSKSIHRDTKKYWSELSELEQAYER